MSCLVEDCTRQVSKTGLCNAHYLRKYRLGDPLASGRKQRPPCSLPGCDRPHAGHGLCGPHLHRLRRHGSPTAGSTSPMAWLEWLQAQGTNPGCWLWPFAHNEAGYGTVRINRRTRKAHRVIYEMSVGEIPEGLLLRHSCDTPPCVNPAHLTPGTHAENWADYAERGRFKDPGSPSDTDTEDKPTSS